MMEIDSDGNENAAPRQRVAISNFTFVHRNAAVGNGAAIRVRGGADYSFANGLIVSDMACLRIDSATTVQTSGPDEQGPPKFRSEEHTSELQSLMRTSYAVFCLKQTKHHLKTTTENTSSPYTQNISPIHSHT